MQFVKTLGVYLSKNMKFANEKTWKEKVEQIENQIKQWKCRKLTYFGKITVFKSLVLSNKTYIISVFPNIDFINKHIEKLIYNLV